MFRSLRAGLARLAGVIRRGRGDAEFQHEVESHLSLHIDDLVRSGISPHEARRRAVLALGGVEQTREIQRDQRGVPVFENFMRDLGYGARGLRRNPGFALAAVAILGLGIGVNTSIFTVVNAVVLRPLPFKDPEGIMRLWHTPPPKLFVGHDVFALSPANFVDWEAQSTSFESMAIYGRNQATLTGQGEPLPVVTGRASASLFQILRLGPLHGRLFTEDDDREGGPKSVVVTEEMWRTRFGADPTLVGRDLRIDGENHTVIGVMEQPKAAVQRVQIWMPLAWSAADRAVRANHNYLAIARLKPGISVEQAQADLTTISKRLEQQYPADNKDWGALVRPLQEDLVGDARGSLMILLGAVALVLLIACANLANLLLVRTHGRAKELAVRTALGATRRRVMVQLLTEGTILGVAGGALGLLASYFGVSALVEAFGTALPRAAEVTPDLRVLAFTAFAALLAGLLASMAPAFQMTRRDATEVLKRGSGRGNSSAGDGFLRQGLVVSEVALALMLLVGAGLLMKSLASLKSVDPGFDARNLLTMTIDLPEAKYKTAQTMDAFFTRALERVRALPGVERASTVDSLPFRGGSSQPVATDKTLALPQSELPIVAVRGSSPGYFDVVRIPLKSGRDFAAADDADHPLVTVVSEMAAARLWPNEDPIGKRITLGLMSNDTREVVGVVGNIKIGGLDEQDPEPAIYLPAAQVPNPGRTLVVRTTLAPESLSAPIVRIFREVDPEQPVLNIMSMDTVVEQSLGQRPLAMMLLAGFAALALTLATIGIYSVIAYSVGQRLREIGIRLALGAPSETVLRMILVEGLKPTLLGIVVGFGLSVALTRFISSQLFGVSAHDPATFGGVAVLVVALGFMASLIPAWRATRVDPMVTLRAE